MEWNSIKMSKAEFERLQKEYTAAAMKTAEKAKHSAISEETPVATQQPVAPVQIVSEAVNSSTEESTVEPENAENTITEYQDLSENDIETAMVHEESNDIEISAEEIENDTEEISAENETEISKAKENSDCDEDNDEMSQDTSDIQQEDENYNTDRSEDSINECDTAEEHTDEEILDSFASVFMSEDEADKKVEKLSADKQKNCPPPNFNSAIHNHNKNMSNSKKPCGCEHCRCQNGNRMQEKGGQKPN